jgi:hypothetical protein
LVLSLFDACHRFPMVLFARAGQKHSLNIPAEILRKPDGTIDGGFLARYVQVISHCAVY